MDTPDTPVLNHRDQQKLARIAEKMRERGMPLQATQGGRIANDSYGALYMRDVRKVAGEGFKGAGNIRVVITEDGTPMRAGHRNKAVRKAELKARRAARKAIARANRETRNR